MLFLPLTDDNTDLKLLQKLVNAKGRQKLHRLRTSQNCQRYSKVSVSALRIVGFFLSRFHFRNIWSRKQVSVLVSEKKVLLSENLVSETNPDQNFGVVTQLTQKTVYILLGSINWAAE